MYRKMMFVGLGGSGGKTLRVLKRDLKEWLIDNDWNGPFPSGWQFVHIDTPSVPDGVRPGGGDLDESEYLGLIGPGVSFDAVAAKIDTISGIDRELLGWRVDGQALGVPLTMGAGQFRAIGRAIAMCYSLPIKERLIQAIGQVNNPAASAELANLYSMVMGKPATVASASPVVVVVSSLAGGTGAGLLVDVCDILRALQPTWGSESISLLYTPDVFLGLGDGAVGGVQPNSLAAVSEVLNGYWWHGGTQDSQVPRKTLSALKAAGIANDITQSGPFCPYLVGSTSAGGVQYTSDIQLFETVGAALVSWATDTKVQQNFIAHTIGNWQAAAKANQPDQDVLVNHGAGSIEPGVPAFSALGFSRVSLGTKYLTRYASKRLAKDSVLHLANAHLASNEAQAIIQSRKLIDPEQIVDELANRYLSWFLRSAELDEIGPDENQIIDRVTPKEFDAQYWAEISRAQELSNISGAHPAKTWIDQIIPAVETATKSFHSTMTILVQENIAEWLKKHPIHVLSVAEDAISRYGLKIAAAMVMKAANVLSNPANGVGAELLGDSEMNNYLRFASSSEWQGQLRLFLDESNKSKFAHDHPAISESIKEAMRYSTCISRAHICERTSDLVVDFANGFLKPLSRALADAAGLLEANIGLVNDWPNWGAGLPPQDLLPPRSEWTLIEPQEFAQTFDSKLAETFANEADALAKQDHQGLARNEVVSGSFIRKMQENSPDMFQTLQGCLLLSQIQSWVADYRVSQKPDPKKEAVFNVNVQPEEINKRATAWMMQSGTPFQLLLSTDLRTYTSKEQHKASTASETEYKTRQRRLIEKLSAAIASAEPLIGIDQNLIGSLHPKLTSGGSIKIKRDVSEVPFLSHPVEQEVRQLLEQTCYGGSRKEQINSVVVGSSKLPHIDVISQLDSPVSPLVVKSLMQPISNSWTAASSSGVARGSFWSNRRGRTLREFVPVPQEHLHAMVRGWFTGKLLGIIQGDVGKEVSIVRDISDRTPSWVSFPFPTLTEPLDFRDQLPTILESLTLAYAEVGTVSSLSPLGPYLALRDLGTSMPSATAELYSYKSLNPALQQWLKNGQLDGASNIQNYKGARPNLFADSENGRRDKLVEFLNSQIHDYSDKYEVHIHAAQSDPSVLGRAPFWPAIKDEIVAALEQLKIAASFTTDSSDF